MLMGGNAVDSAIATMYCNTVVNSQSMGIGGGFIMTIYLGNGTKVMIMILMMMIVMIMIGGHDRPGDRPGRRHQGHVPRGRQPDSLRAARLGVCR